MQIISKCFHEKPSRFRTRCCLLSCPVPVHKTGTRLIPPTVATLWSMSGFHIHMQVYLQHVLYGMQSDYCHLTLCWLVDDVFSFSQLYYWQLKNKNAKIAKAFGLIISEDTSLHKTKIACVFAWSLIVQYILKLFFPLILLNSCIYFSLSNNSSEVVPMGRNKGSWWKGLIVVEFVTT